MKPHTFKLRHVAAVLICLSLSVVIGCGDDDDGPTGPGPAPPLLGAAELVDSFPDHAGNFEPMGVTYDGANYWVAGGGNSSGAVALLRPDFSLLTTTVVDLDCRSIVYNPAQDIVFIKGYTLNGLFALNDSPFDGSFDTVFTDFSQDEQSQICFSPSGDRIYDRLNDTVRVYNILTGNPTDTLVLSPVASTVRPEEPYKVAHSGRHLLTLSDTTVYAYSPTDGTLVDSLPLPGGPFSVWSASYANGLFFVTNGAENLWYVFRIN